MIRSRTFAGLQPFDITITGTAGAAQMTGANLSPTFARDTRSLCCTALVTRGVAHISDTIAIAGMPRNHRPETIKLAVALEMAGVRIGDVLRAAGCRADADDAIVLGTLQHAGTIAPVRGVAAMLSDLGPGAVALIPRTTAPDAFDAVRRGVDVWMADSISQIVEGKATRVDAPPFEPTIPIVPLGDMRDFRGFAAARRAVEVAIAGRLNLLLVAPPGVGATMLARRAVTIMPAMTPREARENLALFSASGVTMPQGEVVSRPWRAPHHSCSEAAIVGGGEFCAPGELNLAQHGVLFLDEVNEFRGYVLESLMRTFAAGRSRIGCKGEIVEYPVRPIIIGRTMPCPCGGRECSCAPERIAAFLRRIPHQLFDMVADMSGEAPTYDGPAAEDSATIRARVAAAWERLGEPSTRDPRPKAIRIAEAIAMLDNKHHDDVDVRTEAFKLALQPPER